MGDFILQATPEERFWTIAVMVGFLAVWCCLADQQVEIQEVKCLMFDYYYYQQHGRPMVLSDYLIIAGVIVLLVAMSIINHRLERRKSKC